MMYNRIIKNDIRNTWLTTIVTLLFVVIAAMLVSLAAILLISLLGANDAFMKKAKTPHIAQMHFGDVDKERLNRFAEDNEKIDQLQITEFLNIENHELVFSRGSLAESVDDNGFAVQNELFDFYLDLEGNKIQAADGEVYIPIHFYKQGIADVGDTLTVYGKEFTVAGLLRDSMMNASLANSKRILISQNDYDAMKDFGRLEYIIEIRLKDNADSLAIQSEYTNAGLESNGVMVHYQNLSLMNALTDGITMGIILIIAIIVTGIAFLCIRFTLMAKVEEEYREIGVMKAIGLRISDIKKLYLAKYTTLFAAGCLIGFALSFLFRDKLTENIRLYMGESDRASAALLYALLSVIIVFLIMVLFVNRVLKIFKKIPAAEALRFGLALGKKKESVHLRLSNNRLFNVNIFLGIKDVWNRKRLYLTMSVVFMVSSFLILVPQNLANTISHRDFMTFMGVSSDFDFQIILQTEKVKEDTAAVVKSLEQEPGVQNVTVFDTKMYSAYLADGKEATLQVALGDHSMLPVAYNEGRVPKTDDEIALSWQNAEAFEKKLGDKITLNIGDEKKEMTVCGFYSDVQNGGRTAKAIFSDDKSATWYSGISVNLKDAAQTKKMTADYSAKYPELKVADAYEYRDQMLGSVMQSINMVSRIALIVALFLTILITVLFLRMLVAKERSAIAALKAYGFTLQDIVIQYSARFILVLIISVLLGTILANVLGTQLSLVALSSLGVRHLEFIINPLSAYVFSPLLMAIAILLSIALGVSSIKKITIMDNIKE